MNRFFLTILALSLFTLLAAACAAPAASPSDPQAVEQAVEATLTAVTASEDPAESAVAEEPDPAPEPAAAATETPDPVEETGEEVNVPALVLPAQVTDFNPAPRPASSMGDPDAPVVIYEWSDYT